MLIESYNVNNIYDLSFNLDLDVKLLETVYDHRYNLINEPLIEFYIYNENKAELIINEHQVDAIANFQRNINKTLNNIIANIHNVKILNATDNKIIFHGWTNLKSLYDNYMATFKSYLHIQPGNTDDFDKTYYNMRTMFNKGNSLVNKSSQFKKDKNKKMFLPLSPDTINNLQNSIQKNNNDLEIMLKNIIIINEENIRKGSARDAKDLEYKIKNIPDMMNIYVKFIKLFNMIIVDKF